MITTKKWIKRLATAFILLITIVIVPLIFPKPLFAYTLSIEDLTIHSDMPIESEKAQILLGKIKTKLAQSPIRNNLQPMQIYIVNTSW